MKKRIRYTQEQQDYLKQIKDLPLKEQVKLFNNKFNLNMSRSALVSQRFHLGLTKQITIHTKEQRDFLTQQLMTDKTTNEIKDLFYKKFGIELTRPQINDFNSHHKIRPPRVVKIGGELKRRKDGSILIKLKDGKYVDKRRYLYEQVYGPVDKDLVFIQLDGDNTNYNIENLKPITRKELLIMSRKHLFFDNKELTKTGVDVAKLILKTIQTRRGTNDSKRNV